MPPASVDPGRLRSLGAALGPLHECTREGAEEVLAQFPEVGDRGTQAALDGWVDQLADLLREIDATTVDLAGRLRVAALAAGAGESVWSTSSSSPTAPETAGASSARAEAHGDSPGRVSR
jgi:hypothetical protein